METDNLLPTIKEGSSESLASTIQTNDTHYIHPQQRHRRSPSIALGVVLVFLMGMLTSRLIPFSKESDSSPPMPGLDILGRNHKTTKHARQFEECERGDYAERTLKRVFEIPFAALFVNSDNQEFDVTAVTKMGGLYAVSRNSWSIFKFGPGPFAPENIIIGTPIARQGYSDYTALFHESGLAYAVRGSVQVSNNESSSHHHHNHYHYHHHAVIEELAFNADMTAFEVLESCPTKMEFSRYGEGIEGAVAIRDENNTLMILGLCGANHCGQSHRQTSGNGALVVLHRTGGGSGVNGSSPSPCVWSTKRMIHIPESADFPDYSDIAMDAAGRVAISSQEKSQVWIGQMTGHIGGGLWDVEKMGFDRTSKVYSFPKNDDCETIYCNIEGIHWINPNTLVAVSGKVDEEQDFRCFDKDQSVHTFVLP